MENTRSSRKSTKKGASNFLIQGTILAAAGIIVRVIGMFYRIPLADILGDEGNGYYSSAFSIYSILLIVSSYSLPTAVSKMIATRLARKEYRNSVRVLKVSLFYGTAVGGIGAAVLWFGADLFANQFLKMPYTSYALKTLAPTIWVIAYLGVFRGYFQGLGTMLPTAISQIFEQIVNAVISIYAASRLFEAGLHSHL
ncbi:oligosaccharide flippase family protein, partial [Clostridium sp. Marseille-P2415]|uniref:oligosaccharide flippase family protein n=1 Tax=Clostridium sp. Marseille-P2415 TaxID=1805471 RepID=UPI0013564889